MIFEAVSMASVNVVWKDAGMGEIFLARGNYSLCTERNVGSALEETGPQGRGERCVPVPETEHEMV